MGSNKVNLINNRLNSKLKTPEDLKFKRISNPGGASKDIKE